MKFVNFALHTIKKNHEILISILIYLLYNNKYLHYKHFLRKTLLFDLFTLVYSVGWYSILYKTR